MSRIMSFILTGLVALAGCQGGGKPHVEEDAGPPGAEDCEPIEERTACEARGCAYLMAARSILSDGVCVAVTQVPVCVAAGDSMNNAINTVCRYLEDGVFEFLWFGSARGVDGWENCGNHWELCGVPAELCEAQTDRAACEANYCYWAPEVRVGRLEDDQCVGWEAATVPMCLKPSPYLHFIDGVNGFDSGEPVERVYSVLPSEGPRRVLGLTVGPAADFASESASWQVCAPYAVSPACGCP